MRKFSLEKYKKMSESFNKKSFYDKIKILSENTDILKLCSDYNWWVVKVIDKEIQEQLEDLDICFQIDNEWNYSQMFDLVSLLNIKQDDI